MNRNPYQVLGISEDASAEEVKKAYRKKARENHPDVNPGDPTASERMNEINEAYDRITNPEKYSRETGGYSRSSAQQSRTTQSYRGYTGGGYGGGNTHWDHSGNSGGGNSYDWPEGFNFEDLFNFGQYANTVNADIHPEASAQDSAEVRAAINNINAGNYQQAARIMSAIPSTGRNARWYYLCAIANHGAGNTFESIEQIRRAVQMDPSNQDYRRAQQAFQNRGTVYQQETAERGFTMSMMNPGMFCFSLCIAQYFCRFFMGF